MAAAAAMQDPPAIMPRVVRDSDGLRIALPGDPGYDEAVPIPLPGGMPMPARHGDSAHEAGLSGG